ncbi:glutathione-regulated potassium-efflux system protein KefC-like [Teleopsis dalmanni]|uniref:glutathione-regulated potassium-efflux system protein KefC-like n=1 Tax=Teleopsis dalmanni TaxID=139649 RepID=UPI0018CCF462|nr:glutathione-regulated potassium-efflux system protein KefC-like [Teleopsis dalmanni]
MNDFLGQAFIFLFSAVICVPISKKLGMGSVLGYLIAGVLIGPYVLKFVGNDGADIMHATEFGVVMMLFLVGLELDPKEFWKMKNKIINLGGMQILGTVFIATIIGVYGLKMNFPRAISIAFAITVSSTAIIMQTLNEKGLTKTGIGKSTFSVLLFQDIMVIPILAIIPLLVGDSLIQSIGDDSKSLLVGGPAFMKTLVIVGAITFIYVIAKYILTPYFKYVGQLQVREIYTSSALLLVIGVSLLMQKVGISPALGAFIAGVVLANNEYKHQLESDIEPFKSLLLGIFFIAVGSTINFKLIVEKPLMILGLTIGIMAIKSFVLWIIGIKHKFNFDQKMLFVLLLSQVGEFAFVILALTRNLDILNKQWYDLMLATTAITMEIVIIAGFGDFGNTISRVLNSTDIKTIVLDNDSERVEKMRKQGFNVFYGDATNVNLLKSAGADHAKYFVAALDPPEINQKLVHIVRKNFPNLEIIVRAKNRSYAYNYLKEGLNEVYRESFFSSVYVGRQLLIKFGFSYEEASKIGDVTMIAPVLKEFIEQNPNVEVYVASRPFMGTIFKQFPEIKFIPVDLNKDGIATATLDKGREEKKALINQENESLHLN